MDSIYNLQKRASALRGKTQTDSITPEEVGGLHYDTLAYMADMEQNLDGLGIRKVYVSVAAMEADKTAPIGTNGKALRLGQLVTIYNASAPTAVGTGNVYAFQKPGWLLVGNMNAISLETHNRMETVYKNAVKQSVMITKTLLYRRIEIVHPADWISNEGLAAWLHTRSQHYLISSASALFSPTDGQLYEIGTACNDLPVGTGGDIHIKMVINGKNNLVRLYVAIEPYNYLQIETAGTVSYHGSSQAEFDSITPTTTCRSLDIKAINETLTTHSEEIAKHFNMIHQVRDMTTETDKVANMAWIQAQLNEKNIDTLRTNTNEKITSIINDLDVHSSDISSLEQITQTNAENLETVENEVIENYHELDDRLFNNETETEQQRADINAIQNKIERSLIKQSTLTTKTLIYRRIEIVHPAGWTSDEGLAAWLHTRSQHYLISSASALFSPTDGQLYEIGTACNDLPVGTGGSIHVKMVINGKNNLVRLYVAIEPYNYLQIETAGNVTYYGSTQAEFDSITPTVPCRSLDFKAINEAVSNSSPQLSLDTTYADDALTSGIYWDTYTDSHGSGKLVVTSASTSDGHKAVEQTFHSEDGPIYKRLLLATPNGAISEKTEFRNIAE